MKDPPNWLQKKIINPAANGERWLMVRNMETIVLHPMTKDTEVKIHRRLDDQGKTSIYRHHESKQEKVITHRCENPDKVQIRHRVVGQNEVLIILHHVDHDTVQIYRRQGTNKEAEIDLRYENDEAHPICHQIDDQGKVLSETLYEDLNGVRIYRPKGNQNVRQTYRHRVDDLQSADPDEI